MHREAPDRRSAWHDCKIGDLLQIKHGYAFLGEHFSNEGTHIVLTPGNFYEEGGFKQKGDKEKWYNGPVPADYVLNEGDLIVAMTEQGEGLLGSSAIIPRGDLYLHNQRLGLILIRDQKQTDPKFIYYLFNSKPVRQQIRGSASGVKIRHTAPSRIGEVKVSVPLFPVQQRIGELLAAYDHLIENNQQRIHILEKMTRSLHREWFVLFRFPGHEKSKLVSSSLGKIPQAWEVKKVGELTSFLSRGISPSYAEDGDSIVVNQKCIRDQRLTLNPARKQTKPIPADKRIRFGDVLINSTGVGTLGRVAQVYEKLDDCTVDTHVTIARPNMDADVDFFGCTFNGLQDTFDRLGVGATGQTELSRAAIGNVELIVPPTSLQRQFGELIRPVRSAAKLLGTQIQNLRRTRDLLLSRLLSGQVEFCDEKAIG